VNNYQQISQNYKHSKQIGDWGFKILSAALQITPFLPQFPYTALPTAAHFSSSLTTTTTTSKNFSKPIGLFRKINYPLMRNLRIIIDLYCRISPHAHKKPVRRISVF